MVLPPFDGTVNDTTTDFGFVGFERVTVGLPGFFGKPAVETIGVVGLSGGPGARYGGTGSPASMTRAPAGWARSRASTSSEPWPLTTRCSALSVPASMTA